MTRDEGTVRTQRVDATGFLYSGLVQKIWLFGEVEQTLHMAIISMFTKHTGLPPHSLTTFWLRKTAQVGGFIEWTWMSNDMRSDAHEVSKYKKILSYNWRAK